ncbi:hypothetical protein ACPCUV_24500 [Streptomyces platensis]|uniref:hypothetical protein n=1 Tax=Streptomyces platensis TaxID=58346 RepID=UPI003C2F3F33
MSTDKPRRMWTPDLLSESPEKRQVHLEQRREQLRPVLEDMRRLAREVGVDLDERDKLEGDLPFQAALRARHTVKPLKQIVADLERVIDHLIAYNARYTQAYEKLPEKRAEKAADRQRLRELKAAGGQAQIEAPAAKAEPEMDDSPLFEHLKRRA